MIIMSIKSHPRSEEAAAQIRSSLRLSSTLPERDVREENAKLRVARALQMGTFMGFRAEKWDGPMVVPRVDMQVKRIWPFRSFELCMQEYSITLVRGREENAVIDTVKGAQIGDVFNSIWWSMKSAKLSYNQILRGSAEEEQACIETRRAMRKLAGLIRMAPESFTATTKYRQTAPEHSQDDGEYGPDC